MRERELERALESATRVNRAQLLALGVTPAVEELVSVGHRGIERLPLADVRCFLAEDKYVRACAPQGELLLTEALKELEERYGGRFLRVHRNALVNLAQVERLVKGEQGWTLELKGVEERPQVSRRHLSALKAQLTNGS